jgi:WD40 repeat protein
VRRRRSSKSPAMLFQKCFPFDEFGSVCVKFVSLLNLLIRSDVSSSRLFAFPNQNAREGIVLMAIRYNLSSLNTLDKSTWNVTLGFLRDMIDEGDFSKDMMSQKFVNYILGSLLDARKIDTDDLLTLCILQALELWGRLLTKDKNINRVGLERALASQSDLCTYIDTEEFRIQIYEKHLYPATRTVENDWIDSVSTIAKKKVSESRSFLVQTAKAKNDRLHSSLAAKRELQSKANTYADIRKRRISDRLAVYEKDKLEASKLWKSSWKDLSFEGRLWSQPSERKFLKLAMVENKRGMRLRHVLNPEGVNHNDASFKRDRISDKNLVSNLKPYYMLPDRQNILKMQAVKIEDVSIENNDKPVSLPSLNYSSQHEVCVLSLECDYIYYMIPIPGRVEVTTTHLRFFPSVTTSSSEISAYFTLKDMLASFDHRRPLDALEKAFLRRYNSRDSAIEAYFSDGESFLFNFPGASSAASKHRNVLLSTLQGLQNFTIGMSPSSFTQADYTKQWVNREISNMEYLSILNTHSGRSFNDLSQYPVYPWIISDYESQTLDLSNPKVFRDLSLPIGALNPSRLAKFQERLQSFEDDPSQPPFLYGTHYSSASSVVFFLVRVEPFTTLHINLQAGKFDHADRQFHSISQLWQSVTTNSGDVKELIPEFYFFPDFLRNLNGFDLGETQNGEVLGDVKLPPWASTPEDFVRSNREALESDYVSQNLHLWIDLIFGYKQSGEEAKKSDNLFHYLTYEGNVDMDLITDSVERKAIEDQAHYFGHTPSQLFKEPHPIRSPLCIIPKLSPNFITSKIAIREEIIPLGLVVAQEGDIFLASEKFIRQYKCEIFPDTRASLVPLVAKSHLDYAEDLSNFGSSSELIAFSPVDQTLFIAGHFDFSIRVYSRDGQVMKLVDRIFGHLDLVSCIATSQDGKWLVSGSSDMTVRLWELSYSTGKCIVTKSPRKVWYGHDDAIRLVSVNDSNRIAFSVSSNGCLLIYPLHHSISPIVLKMDTLGLPCIVLSLQTYPVYADFLVLACTDSSSISTLTRFSINGRLLKSVQLDRHYTKLLIASGNIIALGSREGVMLLDSDSFQPIRDFIPLQSQVGNLASYPSLNKTSHIILAATLTDICIFNLR